MFLLKQTLSLGSLSLLRLTNDWWRDCKTEDWLEMTGADRQRSLHGFPCGGRVAKGSHVCAWIYFWPNKHKSEYINIGLRKTYSGMRKN